MRALVAQERQVVLHLRRFPGFDEKIISMYARGMSVREIVGHLRDLYGVDVSPDLISRARVDARRTG
jgi:transposase-like protein